MAGLVPATHAEPLTTDRQDNRRNQLSPIRCLAAGMDGRNKLAQDAKQSIAQIVPAGRALTDRQAARHREPMKVPATNDLSAFGRHAPRGWLAGAVKTARLCSTSWTGKRFAFALRGVAIRALAGRPLDVEALGARMRLYPGNNVAEKNLLFTPQYFDPDERRFLKEKLGRDFVFIDVGANVGGYALFAAALGGPGARVLAIEPQPDVFERLVFNIRQNSFANVKALDCAVADRDGEITLFVDERNKGESSMRLVGTRGQGTSIRVPAKTLGTIVAEEGYGRIDCVKLDIEGCRGHRARGVLPRGEPDALAALARRRGRTGSLDDGPAGLIAQQAYRVALRTRTNVIYERAES